MLVLLVLLSMTDLALTMTYVAGFGMFEANPVVLGVIGAGSPAVMVTWKMSTLLVAVTILFWHRGRWQAEIGAVLGVLVMLALMVHWKGYIAGAAEMTNELSVLGLASAEGQQALIAGHGAETSGPRWLSTAFTPASAP